MDTKRTCEMCGRERQPDESDEGWMVHPVEGIDLCPDCLCVLREVEAQGLGNAR